MPKIGTLLLATALHFPSLEMNSYGILALIFIMSATNAFAVTEPGSVGPNSACEGSLVEDPFYRLVEKAVESGLLGSEDVARLASAEVASNPLVSRTKQNPALLRGFEQQLKAMTPERWAGLRAAFGGLATRSRTENSARAESREFTRHVLNPRLLGYFKTSDNFIPDARFAEENGRVFVALTDQRAGAGISDGHGEQESRGEHDRISVKSFASTSALQPSIGPKGELLYLQRLQGRLGPYSLLVDRLTGEPKYRMRGDVFGVGRLQDRGFFSFSLERPLYRQPRIVARSNEKRFFQKSPTLKLEKNGAVISFLTTGTEAFILVLTGRVNNPFDLYRFDGNQFSHLGQFKDGHYGDDRSYLSLGENGEVLLSLRFVTASGTQISQLYRVEDEVIPLHEKPTFSDPTKADFEMGGRIMTAKLSDEPGFQIVDADGTEIFSTQLPPVNSRWFNYKAIRTIKSSDGQIYAFVQNSIGHRVYVYSLLNPTRGPQSERVGRAPQSDGEPQLAPKGNCEETLVQDPFAKLIAHALTKQVLRLEDVAKLAAAERAFNPLANLPKQDVALFRGLEQQLAAMTPERWLAVRGGLAKLVNQSHVENSARAESRVETEGILGLEHITGVPSLPGPHDAMTWSQVGQETVLDTVFYNDKTVEAFRNSELRILLGQSHKEKTAVIGGTRYRFPVNRFGLGHRLRAVPVTLLRSLQPASVHIPIPRGSRVTVVVEGTNCAYLVVESDFANAYAASLYRFDGLSLEKLHEGPWRDMGGVKVVDQDDRLLWVNNQTLSVWERGAKTRVFPLEFTPSRTYRAPDGRIFMWGDTSYQTVRLAEVSGAGIVGRYEFRGYKFLGLTSYRGSEKAIIADEDATAVQLYDLAAGAHPHPVSLPEGTKHFGATAFTNSYGKTFVALHKGAREIHVYSLVEKPGGSRAPQSVGEKPTGPERNCEDPLVQDPFYKLIARALEKKILRPEDIAKLASADQAYNPLSNLTKQDVALLRGLDGQLAAMTPERWMQLRARFQILVESSQGENSARAESREHTRAIVGPQQVESFVIEGFLEHAHITEQNGKIFVALTDWRAGAFSNERKQDVTVLVENDRFSVKSIASAGALQPSTGPNGESLYLQTLQNVIAGRSRLVDPLTAETKYEFSGNLKGVARFKDQGFYTFTQEGMAPFTYQRIVARKVKTGRQFFRKWPKLSLAGDRNVVSFLGTDKEAYLLVKRGKYRDSFEVYRFDGETFTLVSTFEEGFYVDPISHISLSANGEVLLSLRFRNEDQTTISRLYRIDGKVELLSADPFFPESDRVEFQLGDRTLRAVLGDTPQLRIEDADGGLISSTRLPEDRWYNTKAVRLLKTADGQIYAFVQNGMPHTMYIYSLINKTRGPQSVEALDNSARAESRERPRNLSDSASRGPSSEKPEPDCEVELLDPFARLVARAVSKLLLTLDQVKALVTAQTPYNPLVGIPATVDNTSIRSGLELELRKMDASRWAAVRETLRQHLKIATEQAVVREESRAETAKMLGPQPIYEVELETHEFRGLRWNSDVGGLELNSKHQLLKKGEFPVVAGPWPENSFEFGDRRLSVVSSDGYLQVRQSDGRIVGGLKLDYEARDRNIHVGSNGQVAFFAVWDYWSKLHFYRFDGNRLHLETAEKQTSSTRLNLFVTSGGELYAASSGNGIFHYRNRLAQYSKIKVEEKQMGYSGHWQELPDGTVRHYTSGYNARRNADNFLYYELRGEKWELHQTPVHFKGNIFDLRLIQHPSGLNYWALGIDKGSIQIVEDERWTVITEIAGEHKGGHLEWTRLPDGRIVLAHLTSQDKPTWQPKSWLRVFDLWTARPRTTNRAPQSVNPSEGEGCQAQLIQDPFYRLVSKALDDQLLSPADLARLSGAESAYNPLVRLPKQNPALLRAFDGQLQTMTPARWAHLRERLAALAGRSAEANSARAESREETRQFISPRLIGQFRLPESSSIRPGEVMQWMEQHGRLHLIFPDPNFDGNLVRNSELLADSVYASGLVKRVFGPNDKPYYLYRMGIFGDGPLRVRDSALSAGAGILEFYGPADTMAFVEQKGWLAFGKVKYWPGAMAVYHLSHVKKTLAKINGVYGFHVIAAIGDSKGGAFVLLGHRSKPIARVYYFNGHSFELIQEESFGDAVGMSHVYSHFSRNSGGSIGLEIQVLRSSAPNERKRVVYVLEGEKFKIEREEFVNPSATERFFYYDHQQFMVVGSADGGARIFGPDKSLVEQIPPSKDGSPSTVEVLQGDSGQIYLLVRQKKAKEVYVYTLVQKPWSGSTRGPQSVGSGLIGPNSACEQELVQDPFYRLVSKALDDQLLSPADLGRLSEAENAYNPLVRLPKQNPALLRAFDGQLQTMTPERWSQLRERLVALAGRSADVNSARAESREETAPILKVRRLLETPFADVDKWRWLNKSGQNVLVVGAYKGSLTAINQMRPSGLDLKVVRVPYFFNVVTGESDEIWIQSSKGDGGHGWDFFDVKNNKIVESKLARFRWQGYLKGHGLFSFSVKFNPLKNTFSLVTTRTESKTWFKPALRVRFQGQAKEPYSKWQMKEFNSNRERFGSFLEDVLVGDPYQVQIHEVFSAGKYIYITVDRYLNTQQENMGLKREILAFDGQNLIHVASVRLGPTTEIGLLGDSLYITDLNSPFPVNVITGTAVKSVQIEDILRIVGDESQVILALQSRDGRTFALGQLTPDGYSRLHTLTSNLNPSSFIGLAKYRGTKAAAFYENSRLHLIHVSTSEEIGSVEIGDYKKVEMVNDTNGTPLLLALDQDRRLEVLTLFSPTRGPQSVGGPRKSIDKNCEGMLTSDPFYRLVEKAVDSGLLQTGDLERLVAAEVAFNPLVSRTKQNPALLRGFETQLKAMTPERWAGLRMALGELASRSRSENSARAESREETRLVLHPELVGAFDLRGGDVSKATSYEKDGRLVIVIPDSSWGDGGMSLDEYRSLHAYEHANSEVDVFRIPSIATPQLLKDKDGRTRALITVRSSQFEKDSAIIDPQSSEIVEQTASNVRAVGRIGNQWLVFSKTLGRVGAYPFKGLKLWPLAFSPSQRNFEIEGVVSAEDKVFLLLSNRNRDQRVLRFDGSRFEPVQDHKEFPSELVQLMEQVRRKNNMGLLPIIFRGENLWVKPSTDHPWIQILSEDGKSVEHFKLDIKWHLTSYSTGVFQRPDGQIYMLVQEYISGKAFLYKLVRETSGSAARGPQSAPEGPKSACEAELVAPDSFYRLIARASDDGLLTSQDLRELGESETPSNPLARRLKTNPAMHRALNSELAKMTPERWAGLRAGFMALSARAIGENSARAESREETAKFLAPRLIDQMNLPKMTIFNLRWQSGAGELGLRADSLDSFLLVKGLFPFEGKAFHGWPLELNGRDLVVRSRENRLLVQSWDGETLADLKVDVIPQVLSVVSNGQMAYIALRAGIYKINFFRYDGISLSQEHSVKLDGSTPRVVSFVRSTGEMYAAATDGSNMLHWRDLNGRYDSIHLQLGGRGHWQERDDGRLFYYTLINNPKTKKQNLAVYEIDGRVVQKHSTNYFTDKRNVTFETVSHPSGVSYLILAFKDEPLHILEEGQWSRTSEIPMRGVTVDMAATVTEDGRVLLAHVSFANDPDSKILRVFELWSARSDSSNSRAPQSVEKKDSDCEVELLDPFVRLVARAVSANLLPLMKAKLLVEAEAPYNPMVGMPVTTDSLSITKAFDRELVKMNDGRWAGVRETLRSHLKLAANHDLVRSESRDETTKILSPKSIYEIEIPKSEIKGLRWNLESGRPRLTLNSQEKMEIDGEFPVELAPWSDHSFAFGNRRLNVADGDGHLQIRDENGQVLTAINVDYKLPITRDDRGIQVGSNGRVAFVSAFDAGSFKLRVYRFDGVGLSQVYEGDNWGGAENLKLFVTNRSELYIFARWSGFVHYIDSSLSYSRFQLVEPIWGQSGFWHELADGTVRHYSSDYDERRGQFLAFLELRGTEFKVHRTPVKVEGSFDLRRIEHPSGIVYWVLGEDRGPIRFIEDGRWTVVAELAGEHKIGNLQWATLPDGRIVLAHLTSKNRPTLQEKSWLRIYDLWTARSDSNNRAPQSAENKETDCEAELVQDPFYRLVNKGLEDQLLTVADLHRLADSAMGYNPLALLPKGNPSLFKALDEQIKAMTPERWARLQPAFLSRASQVVGENSARAESREETAKILAPRLLDEVPLAQMITFNLRWQEGPEGLGLRMDSGDPFRSQGMFPLQANGYIGWPFELNGQDFGARKNETQLHVQSRDGKTSANLEVGVIQQVLSVASNGQMAYIALWAGFYTMNFYRFDGTTLSLEHSVRLDGSSPKVKPFVKSSGEMYAATSDGSNILYRRDSNGRYEPIPLPLGESGHWRERYDGRLFYYTLVNDPKTKKRNLVVHEIDGEVIRTHSTNYSTDSLNVVFETFTHPSGVSYLMLAPKKGPIQILEDGRWSRVHEIPMSDMNLDMAATVTPDGRVLLAHVAYGSDRDRPKVLRVFDLWTARSDSNNRAPQSTTTESAPEGPNSACEAELAPDPFYRLIARASDDGLLTPQDLRELGEAGTPSNPLARRLKTNPALHRALNNELAKMTPERWAGLRAGFVALSARATGENSARAESYDHTARLLALKRLAPDFRLPDFSASNFRWLKDGSKSVLVVTSAEPNRVLHETNGLTVVNLQGQYLGAASPSLSPDQFYVKFWDSVRLVNPVTNETKHKLARGDIGVARVGSRGDFVFNYNDQDLKWRLRARRLGSYAWMPFAPTVKLSAFDKIQIVSGDNEAYIAHSDSGGEGLKLYRFDGREFNQLIAPIGTGVNRLKGKIHWHNGYLYLMLHEFQESASRLSIHRLERDGWSELRDYKESHERPKFWTDSQGRLGILYRANNEVVLDFLEEREGNEYRAALPRGLFNLIGAFQYRGEYVAVVYDLGVGKIVVFDMKSGFEIANFPVRVDRASAHFSIFEGPDGQVFLAAEKNKDEFSIYTLVGPLAEGRSPQSVGNGKDVNSPESAENCEKALAEDPFFRLVEKAVTSGILGSEDVSRLASAEVAYNPLVSRIKQNPALLRGLDMQMKTMTPERWAGLRKALGELSARATDEHSARAESREETAELLGIEEVIRIPFRTSGQAWFEQDSNALLVVSRYGDWKAQNYSDIALKLVEVNYEANRDLIPVNGKIFAVQKSLTGSHLIDLQTGQLLQKIESETTVAFTPQLGWVNFYLKKSLLTGFQSNLVGRPLSGWRRFLPSHATPVLRSLSNGTTESQISSVLSGNKFLYVTVQTETEPRSRLYTKKEFETFGYDGRRFIRVGEIGNPNELDLAPLNSGDVLFWKSPQHPGVLRFFDGQKTSSHSIKGAIRKLFRDEEGRVAVMSEGASKLFVTRVDSESVRRVYELQYPAMGRLVLVGLVRHRGQPAAVLHDAFYRFLYLVDLETGRTLLKVPWAYFENKVVFVNGGHSFIVSRSDSNEWDHVFMFKGLGQSK